MSVKVRILQRWALGAATYDPGNVVEVSVAQANELEQAGIAERVKDEDPK